jgi:hypothetical protein
MAMQKKNVDWAALELAYRTGRSFRLLAKEFGISSTRIKQVADENNWARDLTMIIAGMTQAKLNAANLNGNLNGKKGTERQVVEATVQVQTNIVLAHRADIQRSRKLVVALLQELERETANRQDGAQLSGLSQKLAPDAATGQSDSPSKSLSLAGRANTMKVLADALKTLVGLERQAFNISDEPDPKPAEPARDVDVSAGMAEVRAAFDRALLNTGARPDCSPSLVEVEIMPRLSVH